MNAELLVKLVSPEIRFGYSFTRVGIVTNPGKFEGESIATLYYYDCSLDGGDTVFEVSDDERQAFDIGPAYTHVYLYESENGFVHLYFCTSQDEAEQMQDEDSQDESDD